MFRDPLGEGSPAEILILLVWGGHWYFFSKLLKTGVGCDIDWLWLISVEAGRWVLRVSLYSLFTFEVLSVYSYKSDHLLAETDLTLTLGTG